MNAVRYPTPGEKGDVVKAMDSAKLEKAIAHSTRLIQSHKDKRPSHTDIPALTTWAQDHDVLKGELELLLGQRAMGWKDVPTPPIKEISMPPIKPLSERIATLLVKYREICAAVPSTTSQDAARKLRQQAHQAKFDIGRFCREGGLEMPELPVLPLWQQPAARDLAEPIDRKTTAVPYQEPTTEQIKAMLPETTASTADLDQRDRMMATVKMEWSDELRQFLADARGLFPSWVRPVQEEMARARAKFPTADNLTLALMEEAGEVVKAALDLHNRKPGATLAALHAEIIQTMAMCVRLLEEGDPAVLGTL